MAATKKEVKPDNGKVTINLPAPVDPNEANYEFVSVNGKGYKIMKGEAVEVPAEVAEVLANAEEAKREARLYITRLLGR